MNKFSLELEGALTNNISCILVLSQLPGVFCKENRLMLFSGTMCHNKQGNSP